MPKSKTAPRNYIATLAFRYTLDEDFSDNVVIQYVLPLENEAYYGQLDTISIMGAKLTHADIVPVAE